MILCAYIYFIVLKHNHLYVYGLCSMVFRWFYCEHFFSVFTSLHFSVCCHSQRTKHTLEQTTTANLVEYYILFCWWCLWSLLLLLLFLPIPHTLNTHTNYTELFWFEFCLSSLHTHSVNSIALLHYPFTLIHSCIHSYRCMLLRCVYNFV